MGLFAKRLGTLHLAISLILLWVMASSFHFVTSEEHHPPPIAASACTNFTDCQSCAAVTGCGWCPESNPFCIPTDMSGPLPGYTCHTEIRYKTCLVSLAAVWIGLIITVLVLCITVPLGFYCYRRRDEIAEKLRKTAAERNLNDMASKFRAKYGKTDRKGWTNI